MPTNTRERPAVKSVGIEKIEFDGYDDVYNMEVLGNHNFAVNGGMVIHNCMDACRYFVYTKRLVRKASALKYNPFLYGG